MALNLLENWLKMHTEIFHTVVLRTRLQFFYKCITVPYDVARIKTEIQLFIELVCIIRIFIFLFLTPISKNSLKYFTIYSLQIITLILAALNQWNIIASFYEPLL